jgi:hypothetical protein
VKAQGAPEKIFEQAGCFQQTLMVLRAVPQEDIHSAVTLAEPLVVLSALTTELFLKCLICLESGNAPRGHDLRKLFDQLAAPTRERIENLWNSKVAARRAKEWDRIEELGLRVPRDLPSALARGTNAFERVRYSYEGNTEGVHYYVGDLPTLLEGVILEIKPELDAFRRNPLPLPAVRH